MTTKRMLLTCLILVWGFAQIQSASAGPNVLFLIADDLTAKALSCYGNPQCQTPAIDQLAREGVRFTHAYCQYPVCGPSRAALMSGMYPESIGVMGNGGASNYTKNLGERPSMSQHFQNQGYYAARVSKIYHMRVPGDITAGVDGPDHLASWTERFNCHAPEWMSKGEHEHLTNEKLKFDPEGHYNLGFGGAFYVVRGSTDGSEQADTLAADRAISLLRQHREEPFFLAVGFVRPHVPLVAPEKYFEPYPSAEMQLTESIPNDLDDIPPAGRTHTSRGCGLNTEEKQQKVLSAYYAAVSFMDAQVGRVLNELKALGLSEKTIVVFTSDHGYHLGEHTLWQKMSLHEESARIPLIIRTPDQLQAGTTRDALAEQIDIYPTLSELCTFEIPAHVQGKSLAGVIRGEQAGVRRMAYSVVSKGSLLRTRNQAYLQYRDGTEALYDMQQDPLQFHNLAADPAQAKTLERFRSALKQKQSETQTAGRKAS